MRLGSIFKSTASPQLYTLSLHDALPISASRLADRARRAAGRSRARGLRRRGPVVGADGRCRRGRVVALADHGRDVRDTTASRSEEHTSELQSRGHLVCRLLLEKKKKSYT